MSILVVVENVVVSRTNLREEDLVVTRLVPLVAVSALHCVHLLCPTVVRFRVEDRCFDGGIGGDQKGDGNAGQPTVLFGELKH